MPKHIADETLKCQYVRAVKSSLSKTKCMIQFSKNHKLRWTGMAQSENYKVNYLLSKCETATNHMVFLASFWTGPEYHS